MQRYVAFLRAINVGGRTVRMDQLRALFEALRLGRVETFIASGNVIFDSRSNDPDELERRIERRLEESLGFGVATFIRTPDELAAIAAHRPFLDGGPAEPAHRLYVGFLKSTATEEAWRKLAGHRTATDDFDLRARELYWLCRTRTSDSAVSGAVLERTLGAPATFRNITTVRKLADKYAPPR